MKAREAHHLAAATETASTQSTCEWEEVVKNRLDDQIEDSCKRMKGVAIELEDAKAAYAASSKRLLAAKNSNHFHQNEHWDLIQKQKMLD